MNFKKNLIFTIILTLAIFEAANAKFTCSDIFRNKKKFTEEYILKSENQFSTFRQLLSFRNTMTAAIKTQFARDAARPFNFIIPKPHLKTALRTISIIHSELEQLAQRSDLHQLIEETRQLRLRHSRYKTPDESDFQKEVKKKLNETIEESSHLIENGDYLLYSDFLEISQKFAFVMQIKTAPEISRLKMKDRSTDVGIWERNVFDHLRPETLVKAGFLVPVFWPSFQSFKIRDFPFSFSVGVIPLGLTSKPLAADAETNDSLAHLLHDYKNHGISFFAGAFKKENNTPDLKKEDLEWIEKIADSLFKLEQVDYPRAFLMYTMLFELVHEHATSLTADHDHLDRLKLMGYQIREKILQDIIRTSGPHEYDESVALVLKAPVEGSLYKSERGYTYSKYIEETFNDLFELLKN